MASKDLLRDLFAEELESGELELASENNVRGVVVVHGISKCGAELVEGTHCPIHKPSEHSLNDRPMYWRGDRGFMERLCDHGIGHPDPDSLDFLRRAIGKEEYKQDVAGVHGCDGCCFTPAVEV